MNLFLSFFLFLHTAWSISFDRPVVDEARLLESSESSLLDQKIRYIFEQGGPQLAIVVVQSLNGDVIENVSMKLAEEWKLGSAKQDNGLLIVVAPNERRMRIEVGQGLEHIITDIESNKIIRHILAPAFKKGAYYQGLDAALDEIARLNNLTFEERQTERQYSRDSQQDSPLLFFIIFFLVILIKLFNFAGGGYRGSGSYWRSSGGGGSSWGGGGGGFSGGGSSGSW
jgi:uncharacterized protein